jgi:glycosyltransferase involved in cell wall biosynthesis
MALVRVIHAQAGGGVNGGIAAYVGLLCRNQQFGASERVVTCSDVQNSETIKLYGNSKRSFLPETYSAASLPYFVRRLVEASRTNRCQCIHAHALRAAAASVIAGLIVRTPVIYTNHGIRFSQKASCIPRLISYLCEALVCLLAKHIVCVRQSDLDLLVAAMPWLRKKCSLIRTRIGAFSAATREKQEPANHVLLGVGTVLPVKNPRRFIQWIQLCKKANVSFTAKWLGDGPLRAECEGITKAALLPIEWVGQVTPSRVAEEMSQASLLLITSDYESGPLTALEAMSVGLPVIARGFRGASDVIKDKKTGLILDSTDEHYAGERIAALLNDRALRVQMSESARRQFAEFFCDSTQMVDEYEALYRKLVI